MSETIGLMICGHGSRDERAVEEFATLTDKIRAKVNGEWPVEHGYLEFARPVLREGLDKLRAKGCTRILAVPGMLFAAGHAKNDIPSVLNAYAAEHGIRIDYARELGLDAKMIHAAKARIEEAIAAADKPVHAHDTLLLVVGRGSSDPDANANVAKLTRLLLEGFGFGWAETAYSGVTFPLVGAALERVVRLGFKRIIVFPYFLFTGILVERIYAAADKAARAHPDVEIIKAPYLNDHPLVVETFIERARGILAGDTAMNCALCKYRTQLPAFEHQVGEPQMSHHHHVEGIGTGLHGHGHGQGHGHEHGHGHTHAHAHGHDHDHAHFHTHDHGHAHHHHHAHDPDHENNAPGNAAQGHDPDNAQAESDLDQAREKGADLHQNSSRYAHMTNGHMHAKGDSLSQAGVGKGSDDPSGAAASGGHAMAGAQHAPHHHHHHTHAPYPHADHPLGPLSLKQDED